MAVLALAIVIWPRPGEAKSPSVVVSLPPLHSLVAAIMGDTGPPHLMLRGGRSPHNAALRPSDLRRLRNATLVVWVGPTLESFLAKPVAAIKKNATIITLLDLQPMKRLSRRKGRSWEKHDHDHEAPRGLADTVIDPHVWLSPINAVAIAKSVSQALISQDAANAASYKRNTQNLITRIGALDKRLGKSLAPVRRDPYLVFHDAYQYFERHFTLNAVGAITINPERRSGARRIAEIRRRLEQSGVRCVFREPQFPPRMLNTIVKGTKARIGILDPLGAAIQPGPDHWFKLMSDLGRALVECLGNRS
jgi:zinc transport system substrate-binding protein